MAWLTVLGIPAALYVVGITALMFYVQGNEQNPILLIGSGLLTAGIYMFHRTSVDAVEPMQERHRLALRHKKIILAISYTLLVSAISVFAIHHPLTTLLVFCSLAGVIVYGRRTLTKPLRTFPFLKPFVVGSAIALFGWVLNDFSNSIITLLAFILICSADALVCDLVDCEFDTATGCITLAKKLGPRLTWCVAGVLYLVAAIELESPIGWIILLAFPLPSLFQTTLLRTCIDLRPILLLLIAWTV
ncbi:MAG: hypothetical protein QGI78_05870 [Phycisphaerales bacterium]|jgi:4-hydroxybenzoate polyprenyltransferase|nr:hypothetical protein [Phycisphaerales bacterium]